MKSVSGSVLRLAIAFQWMGWLGVRCQLWSINNSGEAAKELFLQSKLPLDILGKVWTLVDSAGIGKLSENQFMAAMVIIAKLRSGQLVSVPTSIPQSLWNSITKFTDVGIKVSSNNSITNNIPPSDDTPWVIPETDQNQFSLFFDKLDKVKSGFVTGNFYFVKLGEQAYSFFLKSKLPEEYLAVVW